MKIEKLTGDLAARILAPSDRVPAPRRLAPSLAAAVPFGREHRLFVRTAGPGVPVEAIEGVTPTAPAAGTVRTALATDDGIRRLAERDDVVALSPSPRLHPLLDLANAQIRVPPYRSRTGASGRGVVIGVVDTGIDALHPAFGSRVLRVWDQTVTGGAPPAGFAYGHELIGPAPAHADALAAAGLA